MKKKRDISEADDVPGKKGTDEILGFLKGKVKITGDIVAPALTKEEWGSLWPANSEEEDSA